MNQPQGYGTMAMRPCPFCGEGIQEVAIKCRHCGEFLDGRPRAVQSKTSVGRIVGIVFVILVLIGGLVGAYIATGVGADVSGNCSLNGFGNGSCEFSNHGWSPGTTCVWVFVRNRGGATSERIRVCSDLTWPGQSHEKKVIVELRKDLCEANVLRGEKWSDFCDVEVEPANK